MQLLKTFALMFLAVLAPCVIAGGDPKMYFHSFSFDTLFDAKKFGQADVDVLDFAYGDSGLPRTRADEASKAAGRLFRGTGTAGMMPRGEFLYVKWRIKATDEVHEDRVDLRDRLPLDMTNHTLHFLIDGAQLYVFVTPPKKFVDGAGRISYTSGGWTRAIYYSDEYTDYRRQHQIYPDQSN